MHKNNLEISIRLGMDKDIEEIREIYNYEILNGTATFDITSKETGEFREWFKRHLLPLHPIFVATINERVVGWAALSSYRDKEAYRGSGELSLYIHHEYRGCGIGNALMKRMMDFVKDSKDINCLISVITRENDASKRLHQKYGFQYCGRLEKVGYKFGRYLDIEHYLFHKE